MEALRYLKLELSEALFFSKMATPYARIAMEIELFPMLLWPVSDTLITQGGLLGVLTGPDRTEAVSFPLTFNSLSYSKYCWQEFWLLVIHFGPR